MTDDRHIGAPFLTVSMMAESNLFDRHFTTLWRWAASGKFPVPDLVVGGRELWAETTIREWAASRKLTLNEDALDAVRASQLPQ
jgi:hypothetical protein